VADAPNARATLLLRPSNSARASNAKQRILLAPYRPIAAAPVSRVETGFRSRSRQSRRGPDPEGYLELRLKADGR
jgi:hypothetical protein